MNAHAAQLSALKWLRNRNGDGVFEVNNQVLVAAGERAPVMRATWNRLEALGYVERYKLGRRLRVTQSGLAVDLTRVRESEAAE